jgi:hypothetical protein
MITTKLLCYGLTDDDNYYVDFHFDLTQIQAFFMANEKDISLVISGQIYEVTYSESLLNLLKKTLSISNKLNFN